MDMWIPAIISTISISIVFFIFGVYYLIKASTLKMTNRTGSSVREAMYIISALCFIIVFAATIMSMMIYNSNA